MSSLVKLAEILFDVLDCDLHFCELQKGRDPVHTRTESMNGYYSR